jgi:hypothetical protein
VRPAVKKAILTAEIARDFQTWLDLHGVFWPSVFENSDRAKIENLVDTFNRFERAIAKVEDNTYGLKFYNGKIDILAPATMNPEEYQDDVITGFSGLPVIIAIGVLVVAAIVATAYLIETIAGDERIRLANRMIDAAKEIQGMSPEMQTAFKELLEENKDKIREAGLLDKLLGGGSGLIIAGGIALAVLLYAYTRSK